MIILIDGINKKEVLERAEYFKNEVFKDDNIKIVDIQRKETMFSNYLYELNDTKETKILINGILTDQAESIVNKESPILTNNEILSIVGLVQGKGFLVYCVNDDVDYMFENAESYSDLEEFKTKLRAYNISAGAMKTLLPVVPMTNKK